METGMIVKIMMAIGAMIGVANIYSLLMYKRLRRLSSQFKRTAIDKIESKKSDGIGEEKRLIFSF